MHAVRKKYGLFLKYCREIIYVLCNAAVMSSTPLVCVCWAQQMVVLRRLNAAFGVCLCAAARESILRVKCSLAREE